VPCLTPAASRWLSTPDLSMTAATRWVPTGSATVISGSPGSGSADVNAALPAPELHPVARTVTPIIHANKFRVRIVAFR
jgi:hypothetical protein